MAALVNPERPPVHRKRRDPEVWFEVGILVVGVGYVVLAVALCLI